MGRSASAGVSSRRINSGAALETAAGSVSTPRVIVLSLEAHIAPGTAAAAAAAVYGSVKLNGSFVRTRTCLSSLKGELSKSIKMLNTNAGCSVTAGQRGERRRASRSFRCLPSSITAGRSDAEETEEKRREHPERHTSAARLATPHREAQSELSGQIRMNLDTIQRKYYIC